MELLVFGAVFLLVVFVVLSMLFLGKLFVENPWGFILSLIGIGFLFGLSDDDCDV